MMRVDRIDRDALKPEYNTNADTSSIYSFLFKYLDIRQNTFPL